jgi:hypothetical protein
MKLAREETNIKVTGRSFYRKNNLKFKGSTRNRNRNRGKKKFGTRNLGKMARFRNTALMPVFVPVPCLCPCPSLYPYPCPFLCSCRTSDSTLYSLISEVFISLYPKSFIADIRQSPQLPFTSQRAVLLIFTFHDHDDRKNHAENVFDYVP